MEMMELELGLGLALPTPPLIPNNLLEDLNSYGSNALQKLGPTSDIQTNSSSSSSGGGRDNKKCSFDEKRNAPKTLQLLHWSSDDDQLPNDDDPSSQDLRDSSAPSIFKNDGEGLVGWPPLKTLRKKLRHGIPNDGASRSTNVKVKMEGVAIGRKMDLSVHHSFEALSSSLMRMFGISEENRNSFKLGYQDPEGDWLLAEDVPWRTFIRSLRCLKLIKS